MDIKRRWKGYPGNSQWVDIETPWLNINWVCNFLGIETSYFEWIYLWVEGISIWVEGIFLWIEGIFWGGRWYLFGVNLFWYRKYLFLGRGYILG